MNHNSTDYWPMLARSESVAATPVVSKAFSEDLSTVLCQGDKASGIWRLVTANDAAAWSVTVDEMFAAVLEPYRRPQARTVDSDSRPATHQIQRVSDSNDPSAAVCVAHFQSRVGPHGSIVAVPSRRTVLWHDLQPGSDVWSVVNDMLDVSLRAFDEDDGRLSRDLYWVRPSGVTRLPLVEDDRGLRFQPPDSFIDAINDLGQVVPSSSGPAATQEATKEAANSEVATPHSVPAFMVTIMRQEEVPRNAVTMPISDKGNLVAVLLLQTDEGVEVLPSDVWDSNSLTFSEVLEEAVRNSFSPVPPIGITADDGTPLDILKLRDSSIFIASFLLELKLTSDETSLLVAIPSRHTLLMHRVNDQQSAVKALNRMVAESVHSFQNDPNELSPSMFWIRQGEIVDLPVLADEEGIMGLEPPESFREFVRSLP